MVTAECTGLRSLAADRVSQSKIFRAAQDFETVLLVTLIGPLEKTFSTVPGEQTPSGGDAYQSMEVQGMATALVQHGGFGVANMVARSLSKSGSLP